MILYERRKWQWTIHNTSLAVEIAQNYILVCPDLVQDNLPCYLQAHRQ